MEKTLQVKVLISTQSCSPLFLCHQFHTLQRHLSATKKKKQSKWKTTTQIYLIDNLLRYKTMLDHNLRLINRKSAW